MVFLSMCFPYCNKEAIPRSMSSATAAGMPPELGTRAAGSSLYGSGPPGASGSALKLLITIDRRFQLYT